MRKYIGLLLIFSILTMNVGAVFSGHVDNGPRIKNQYGDSVNWAGYAVTGPDGSVTNVKGSWTVPTVDCVSTPNSYSASWTGIDGYNSGTVEQIGTSSNCRGTTPEYYAWYEFYPKFSFSVPIPVTAGDVISAEVNYKGKGQFVATITNTRTGQTFSKTGKVAQAKRSSAEWIIEAPWSGGVLPLANFGVANFGPNYATVNGISGNIGSFGTAVQSITMVSYSNTPKAQPSALSGDGNFSVQWLSTGP